MKPGYYWLAAPPTTFAELYGLQLAAAPAGTRRHRARAWQGEPLSARQGLAPGEEARDEKREVPLLLHPEKDDPEKHLEFLVERSSRRRSRGVDQASRARKAKLRSRYTRSTGRNS